MASISISKQQLADFCQSRGIVKLAIFGSAIHDELGPDSDIDVLVEFQPTRIPGLFGIARLERELSTIFGGRKVDLRTPEDLSPYFRNDVVEEAEVQYAEG